MKIYCKLFGLKDIEPQDVYKPNTKFLPNLYNTCVNICNCIFRKDRVWYFKA